MLTLEEALKMMIDTRIKLHTDDMPWLAGYHPDYDLIFVSDSRDDADHAIIQAIAKDRGLEFVIEGQQKMPDGRLMLGALFKGKKESVAEFQTAYHFATQPDPSDTEPPF